MYTWRFVVGLYVSDNGCEEAYGDKTRESGVALTVGCEARTTLRGGAIRRSWVQNRVVVAGGGDD